jgi:hypothetical protein
MEAFMVGFLHLCKGSFAKVSLFFDNFGIRMDNIYEWSLSQYVVITSVVWLFLLERTFNLVLTFKIWCGGSPNRARLFQNLNPFCSNSITFFQIQGPLDLIFELGLVPYTHCTFTDVKAYAGKKIYN